MRVESVGRIRSRVKQRLHRQSLAGVNQDIVNIVDEAYFVIGGDLWELLGLLQLLIIPLLTLVKFSGSFRVS